MAPPEADELNALSSDDFAAALAPLFEGAPRFLHRLAAARPFDSDATLLAAAADLAAAAPEPELVQLLNAHPRIGARPAEMSTLSNAEQNDGTFLETLVEAELAILNAAYEERFGFRYVVFVAGRPRAAILPLIESALAQDRDDELRRGAMDAVSIAVDRLARLRHGARRAQAIGS